MRARHARLIAHAETVALRATVSRLEAEVGELQRRVGCTHALEARRRAQRVEKVLRQWRRAHQSKAFGGWLRMHSELKRVRARAPA